MNTSIGSLCCCCVRRNVLKHIWNTERVPHGKLMLARRYSSLVASCSVLPHRNINNDRNVDLMSRTLLPVVSSLHELQNFQNFKRFNSTDTQPGQNESKVLTIPNILTGGRLVAAPYIGYLVFCQDFNWALGLFVLAAVTDSVDGWIARNMKGQSSILGSYIDPLADKVLVSVLTFSLTCVGIIPKTLCVLIILRDVMIMSSAAHFHYKHLEPPKTMERFFDFENSKVQMEPTQISKYNTFLQLGLVAFSLTAPVLGFVDHPYLQAYWYLVASTTVLSGLSYVVKDKSAYFVK